MAVIDVTEHSSHSTYEMVIDATVFHEDIEHIEYVLGQSIESINFVEDAVVVELMTQLFCSDLRVGKELTRLDNSICAVLDAFLNDDQGNRLRETICKMTGLEDKQILRYTDEDED